MKIVNGDILTPNSNKYRKVLVCHQVNCMRKMGAGLALQIKLKYRNVYLAYLSKCQEIQSGKGGLGDIQVCDVTIESGYSIVNIFGQYYYGRGSMHTDYDALHRAFTTIADNYKGYVVRIPYMMGCGLGGGDWRKVYQLIQDDLVSKGIEVELWKL